MRLGLLGLFLLVNLWTNAQADTTKSLTDTAAIDSTLTPVDTIGWHTETTFDLKFTQVTLHNWAAGGQSSIAFNTAFSFAADYKGAHTTWTNSFDVDFGFFNQARSIYWAKSDDRIELNSLFGRVLWHHWEIETFLSFKSQFAKGYSNPLAADTAKLTISDFLAPGYIGTGIGVDYKPSEHFNLLVAPVSFKLTMINNQLLADQGAFGAINEKDSLGNGIAGSGKKIRREFGGTFKIMYKAHINDKFDVHAKLELFSNYLKNPQNVDVNSEILANWKLNKFLSVSINLVLIYDDDVQITRNTSEIDPTTGLFKTKTGPTTQFREIFGLGFNCTF